MSQTTKIARELVKIAKSLKSGMPEQYQIEDDDIPGYVKKIAEEYGFRLDDYISVDKMKGGYESVYDVDSKNVLVTPTGKVIAVMEYGGSGINKMVKVVNQKELEKFVIWVLNDVIESN